MFFQAIWNCLTDFESDRAPVNHHKIQAAQQFAEHGEHDEHVELLPIASTAGTDSGQSDQTGLVEVQQYAAHAQERSTSQPSSTPNELSGAPDHNVFKNPGPRTLTAPECELSETYRQYQYTAQNARTIEMVTIDSVQIQHLFTVYVCHVYLQPRPRSDAEDSKATSHIITPACR